MPELKKGKKTHLILLSKASFDMLETLIPMAIPTLAAHFSDLKIICFNK